MKDNELDTSVIVSPNVLPNSDLNDNVQAKFNFSDPLEDDRNLIILLSCSISYFPSSTDVIGFPSAFTSTNIVVLKSSTAFSSKRVYSLLLT